MEIVAENLVKEIVDASIEVKSISDCIDDCEYGAAKKLLLLFYQTGTGTYTVKET